jgi:methylmalonyl-CoA mutase N-terminal domain/subunit
MRDRYGAQDEKSWKLRFHAQTAGCSLTWQQPNNNIVRTAIQALAAVLGGCQSLHTNSLDEAYALPSEQAVTLALRTQQVIAFESGITATPDPLGGSFYVENLTQETGKAAQKYIDRIDAMGGMIEAIEQAFPQSEVAEASYQYQKGIESCERVIAGVNAFQEETEQPIEVLQLGEASGREQSAKLEKLRKTRDAGRVAQALDGLREAATGTANTMPYILEAVRASATLGEMCEALRNVFGTYQERGSL